MKAEHEPDPAFVDHLEWQLRTTLRRRERFAEPVSRRARSLARTAGLVLLSLTVGAAGAVAANRFQDEEQRELLLAHNAVQLELAQTRSVAADDALDAAETLAREGVASPAEAREALRRALDSLCAVERLELDQREIALSGRRPDDSLSAPKVAGQDFVVARLELESALHLELLGLLEADQERVAVQIEAGRTSPVEGRVLAARVEALAHALQLIRDRIGLRLRFLRGELTVEEVELESLRLEAEGRLKPLLTRLQLLHARLEKTEKLREKGATSEASVRDLRLEVREVESAIRLRQLELQMLDSKLGRSSAKTENVR